MSEKYCKYCLTKDNLFTDKRGVVYAICTSCKPKKDKERAALTKKNLLEKHGVTNVSQLQKVKDKKKETTLNHFGVEYPTQSKKVVSTMKQNNIGKYGVENVSQLNEVKEKKRQTCLDNWGVETNLQLEECKELIKSTCQERYNTDNPHQAESVILKTINTNLTRYGETAPAKNKQIQEKIQQTSLERYGNKYHLLSEEIQTKIRITRISNYWETFLIRLNLKKLEPLFSKEEYTIKNNSFKFKCNRCNSIIETNKTNPQHIRCTCTKNSSRYEDEISDWLISLGIVVEKTQRFYKNKENQERYEIDIFIPSKNIGIEFHGLYWHSHIYKERRYHQEKYLFFKERDIQLIQIFENEWLFKKEIVKSLISSKLNLLNRIYARECILKELDNKESNLFLEQNHLQGGIVSSTNRIGLFYKNELACVGVFGKNRFEHIENSSEVLRFATKLNFTVVGGFSKILKYYETTYCPTKLVSFVDPRYFSGQSYSSFNLQGITSPNYFYFKPNDLVLYSRVQFQKHKLKNKLEIYDELKSELENMELNGYLRIYDAGHLKFYKEY